MNTLEDRAVSLPACTLCGQVDVEMDSWLGVCHACLARAGSMAVAGELRRPGGPKIGGYTVERLIGSGGMGSVHEAVRESDGLRVALKLIQPEMAAEPRFREQFLRESEALRVLEHPGVVRRLDAGEDNGLPYLVMEFVDGPDLRQVLRHGLLAVPRALEIIVEAGAALAAAHAAGIVHRDIKPANLLLDGDGRVKVADFGMARSHLAGSTATDPHTLVAAAAGHYSAPELERKGAGDARADVYSLGALLYHLLTGHAPRANYRLARRQRPGAGISAGLDRIIVRALQTEPDKRFRTMAEMVAALQQEQRRLARPDNRTVPWLMGGMALIIGVVWGFWPPSQPHGAASPADREREELVAARVASVPRGWQSRKWVNSLGMPFVSIPNCPVLFCVWETRVSDYVAFAQPWAQPDAAWVQESGFAFPLKTPFFSLRHGEFKAAGRSWQSPGFPTGPEHAVCGISASDAMAFCTWLTWKERKDGKIRADQAYRLPKDEEWSAAAGLVAEPGSTPEQRAASWPSQVFVHPWGADWPPPSDHYNVVGDEVDEWEDWHAGWIHRSRRDPWRGTAPVQAVPASPLGLHHLTGNVAEWTESRYNEGNEKHTLVLRGGCWQDASREGLSLAYRNRDAATMRITMRGFRVVFQESAASGWRYGGGQ